VYIGTEGASFERTFTMPLDPVAAWDWLTSPALRSQWDADRLEVLTPGGRQRAGVTNHCVHGADVMIEQIVDWRPFDYYTTSYDLPGVGPARLTTQLEPRADDSTAVTLRGEGFEGERLVAWEQISEFMLTAIDASIDSLARHLPGVTRVE
jgi:hypothetical protein